MRRNLRLYIVLFFALLSQAHATEFTGSFLTGYKGGFGVRASGLLSNFSPGFPLGVEFGVGYTSMDPGDPGLARRIFINDATDGVPQKSGWTWDFRTDFLIKLPVLGLPDASVFFGARYLRFTGNFRFVDGNEDVDITSGQWGWGMGVKSTFPMTRVVGLTVLMGFDHFPSAQIYGHDTTYSPDGQDVNPHHQYKYKDAVAAVNQPRFQGVALIGLSVVL